MKILITKLFGAALFLGASCSLATADTYSVINIPDDGTLTLRAWPSQISKPLSNIPANTQQIEATGKTIILDSVNWLQVSYQDNVGWVESNYLKQAQAQAQAQQPQIQASISQENKGEIVDSAELFSYGASVTTEPNPAPTIQTAIKPTASQYPWSAEADTIYNDPKSKNTAATTPVEITQAPTANTEPLQATPAANLETTTQTSLATQNPVVAIAPQPVTINTIETPIDYREENISGNRYEAIETATTMGFIDN